MNYKNEDITKRAEESSLWPSLSKQQSETLPYLLERYLLLENWKSFERALDDDAAVGPSHYDVQFLHTLLAEVVTVLLSQEERIRKLEQMHSDYPPRCISTSYPL